MNQGRLQLLVTMLPYFLQMVLSSHSLSVSSRSSFRALNNEEHSHLMRAYSCSLWCAMWFFLFMVSFLFILFLLINLARQHTVNFTNYMLQQYICINFCKVLWWCFEKFHAFIGDMMPYVPLSQIRAMVGWSPEHFILFLCFYQRVLYACSLCGSLVFLMLSNLLKIIYFKLCYWRCKLFSTHNQQCLVS